MEYEINEKEKTIENPKRRSKCWSVFALVGMILGIVSLCLCIFIRIKYYVVIFSIPGIVFSILGLFSKNKAAKVKSIIGLVISSIITIVFLIITINYLAELIANIINSVIDALGYILIYLFGIGLSVG